MMATNGLDFREELEKIQKDDETNCFCFDCGKESNRGNWTLTHQLFVDGSLYSNTLQIQNLLR